jgi:hypothetical protein
MTTVLPDPAQVNMKPNISPTILPNPVDDLSGLSSILNSKVSNSLVDFQKLKGGSNKIKNQNEFAGVKSLSVRNGYNEVASTVNNLIYERKK